MMPHVLRFVAADAQRIQGDSQEWRDVVVVPLVAHEASAMLPGGLRCVNAVRTVRRHAAVVTAYAYARVRWRHVSTSQVARRTRREAVRLIHHERRGRQTDRHRARDRCASHEPMRPSSSGRTRGHWALTMMRVPGVTSCGGLMWVGLHHVVPHVVSGASRRRMQPGRPPAARRLAANHGSLHDRARPERQVRDCIILHRPWACTVDRAHA